VVASSFFAAAQARPRLRRAINATGVVLHTNLGRAPLAAAALERVRDVASGYSNLEYDLSSGSRGSRHDHLASILRRLTGAGRSALLQPYLERVDDHGETALMFFRGRFSHAVRKGPLLQSGADPTDQLFAAEEITPRTPDANELRVGELALAAIPFPQLLYARVDLVRDAHGMPRVLELEVTEPSLFFAYAPESAPRFVQELAEFIPPHWARRHELRP